MNHMDLIERSKHTYENIFDKLYKYFYISVTILILYKIDIYRMMNLGSAVADTTDLYINMFPVPYILFSVFIIILFFYDRKILSSLQFSSFRKWMLCLIFMNIMFTDYRSINYTVFIMAVEFLSSLLILSKYIHLLIIPLSACVAYFFPDVTFVLLLFTLVTYYSINKLKDKSCFVSLILAYLTAIIIFAYKRRTTSFGVFDVNGIVMIFFASYISLSLKRCEQGSKHKRICTYLIVFNCAYLIISNNAYSTALFSVMLLCMCILCDLNSANIIETNRFSENDLMQFNNWLILYYSVFLMRSLLYKYKYIDSFMDEFRIDHYYINYFDYGFVQRGLIGTIVRVVFGYYIPIKKMKCIAFALYNGALMLIYAIAIILLRIRRNYIYLYTPMLWLYLILIFPSMFILHQERLDIFAALLSVLNLILICKNTSKIVLVVPLCACSMMIHPAYIFILYPAVFLALCVRTFLEDEGNFTRNLLVTLSSLIVVCGLFIYFTDIAYIIAPVDIDMALRIFNDRSDSNVLLGKGLFWVDQNLFFRSNQNITVIDHAKQFSAQISKHQVKKMVYKFVFLMPLFICFFYEYRNWSLCFKDRRRRFLCRALSAMVCIAVIPLYIFEVDYGRWSLYLVFMLVCCILLPNCTLSKSRYELFSKVSTKQEVILGTMLVVSSLVCGLFNTLY